MRFSRSAVKLACEIIKRRVLTREELEAIMRCGNAPGDILRTAISVYKDMNSFSNNRGGRNGGQEGEKGGKDEGSD